MMDTIRKALDRRRVMVADQSDNEENNNNNNNWNENGSELIGGSLPRTISTKLFESEVKIVNFENEYSFEHYNVNNNCEELYKIHRVIQDEIQNNIRFNGTNQNYVNAINTLENGVQSEKYDEVKPYIEKIPEIFEYSRIVKMNGHKKVNMSIINKKKYNLLYNRYIVNSFWIVESLNDFESVEANIESFELFFNIVSSKLLNIFRKLKELDESQKETPTYYKNMALLLMLSTLKISTSSKKRLKNKTMIQKSIKKELIAKMEDGNVKKQIIEIKNKMDGYLMAKWKKSLLNSKNTKTKIMMEKKMSDVESLKRHFKKYLKTKEIEKKNKEILEELKFATRKKNPQKRDKLFEIANLQLELYKISKQKARNVRQLETFDQLKIKMEKLKILYNTNWGEAEELQNKYNKAIQTVDAKIETFRYRQRQNQYRMQPRTWEQQTAGYDDSVGWVDDLLVDFIDNSNVSGIF